MISMKVGYANPTDVYRNVPLDPNFSWKYFLIAIVGAVVLQLGGSWVHLWFAPVALGSSALMNMDIVVQLIVVGWVFPVMEEVGFRVVLWRTLSSILKRFVGRKEVPWIAMLLVSLIFCSAHIPAWGLLNAAMLLPISLFLGFLRLKTGGIFTSTIAHATFNSLAIVL